MDRRPRVFISGPMSPTKTGSPIEYLANCRRMIAAAVELIKKGFAPFCPAVDMLYFLNGEWADPITGEEIKAYSLAWLPVCEAILLMPGWKDSAGARKELALAVRLGIPKFNSIDGLLYYFEGTHGE